MCAVGLAGAIDCFARKFDSTCNRFLSFNKYFLVLKNQNRTTCHVQIISQSIFLPRSKASPKDSRDIELTHVKYA
jgi:hypothetical protein